MNISLLKENYEKYKDLKHELDNLKDYGWQVSFCFAFGFIAFLMLINIEELIPLPLALFFGAMGFVLCIPISLQLIQIWNSKERKYKNINYLKKFGYNKISDALYFPSNLDKIEEKYKKISPNIDFDIIKLRQLDTNTEYSFLIDIITINLEKKEGKVIEDLECFILNELVEKDKIKFYKKYLNKKLNNINKSEILEQKDSIIDKIMSNDFSQKEKLELINLLENKIKQKAEECFESSIQEKLKNIEENALKLKENVLKLKEQSSINVNKNKIIKSI